MEHVKRESNVIVVGTGIAGLAAAIRAFDLGLSVRMIEKAGQCGGSTAYSGGQVWVGANHVAARAGIIDSVEDTFLYVSKLANEQPEFFDETLARQWIENAPLATQFYEESGVVSWEVIPDFPDYFYPAVTGSRKAGRYLTGAMFQGEALGGRRDLLLDSPHYPSGITYAEMLGWGGLSSKNDWNWDLLTRRGQEDILTFGHGLAGYFLNGVLDRGIEICTSTRATELLVANDVVVGVRGVGPDGSFDFLGEVILAAGAHDWSEPGPNVPDEQAPLEGSLAPTTLTGDALQLAERVGASITSLPLWAGPRLPGYKVPQPQYVGDAQYRICMEASLPHTFLVNREGQRFCDDSFYQAIVRAALKSDDAGRLPNAEIFMIWDETHHEKYGLGMCMPGEPYYPDGLVTSDSTIAGLAKLLGIDAAGLEQTAREFNQFARDGTDPIYGRGSNASAQAFRGDRLHLPNPNIGPVDTPPFHGMQMCLVGTGIPTRGIRTGIHGRVIREDKTPVTGLYAIGACAVSAASGVGYNSGFTLSRAMTFGYLSATDIAQSLS